MLGIFLIILSGILVWFSVVLLEEMLELKKYLVNIECVFKNYFFIFCVIFLINIISWSILGSFSTDSINQETINLVFKSSI